MIKFDDSHLLKTFNYKKYAKKVAEIDAKISDRSAVGSDFLGWEKIDDFVNQKEIEIIIEKAEEIRKNYEILLVCGIGGSYLGSRAAIEAIKGYHKNNSPKILFIGHTFSSDFLYDTLERLKGKKFAINVISKSGTTTETSIAFRMLKDLMIKEHGYEYSKKAIIVTTDPERGLLRKMVKDKGYFAFDLKGNIGGRYSVLTAVGLFPMACAGIDIKEVIKGAKESEKLYRNPNIFENEAYKYAAVRHFQYKHGKKAEMLVTYEPRLVQFGEWYKQLFGESEGKEHKALFPISATFSTDLHSLGQFIQDGSPIFFETIVYASKSNNEVIIPKTEHDSDELNYLEGKSLDFVMEKAYIGTLDAHSNIAKVPCAIINVDNFSAHTIGELFYFFEKACAMSAYLLGVNPFNQPGVEVYKKNMFTLLGKKK